MQVGVRDDGGGRFDAFEQDCGGVYDLYDVATSRTTAVLASVHLRARDPLSSVPPPSSLSSLSLARALANTPRRADFDAEQTRKYHVKPWMAGTNHSLPRPLALWSGYMAPGPNKPVAWLEAQGPEIVQKYNKAMKEVLEEESEGEVWEGAWRSLEWYGVTEGVSPFPS